MALVSSTLLSKTRPIISRLQLIRQSTILNSIPSNTLRIRAASTMATPWQIRVPPADTGILKWKQTDEAAAKVSELLQKDLERHHVFFNKDGFHNHVCQATAFIIYISFILLDIKMSLSQSLEAQSIVLKETTTTTNRSSTTSSPSTQPAPPPASSKRPTPKTTRTKSPPSSSTPTSSRSSRAGGQRAVRISARGNTIPTFSSSSRTKSKRKGGRR